MELLPFHFLYAFMAWTWTTLFLTLPFVVTGMRSVPIHAGVVFCFASNIALTTKKSLRTLRDVTVSGATHVRKPVRMDGQMMKVVSSI
jgi:hypothetical protein